MLRTILVLVITALGIGFAFQGALYSLLFYLWVAYFRPETWVWNDWVRNLNLSYAVGAWTVIAVVLTRVRWRFNVRVLLLGLFLLQTLLSALFTSRPDYVWPFWVEFCKTACITYLIVILVTSVADLRLALLVIGLSLGFEAAKQGWMGLLTHPGAANLNELPMLGDNNGVAVGILMLVPILTALAGTAKHKGEETFLRILAVGSLYRAISTYSRGGFLACGALGVMYLSRSSKRMAAVLGVMLVVMLIAPAMPNAFWDRMSTINQAEDGSALGRLHFWQVAIDMADEHPLVGVGHNAYNAVYDDYDHSNQQFGAARSVHSIWFGYLAELGYPGLLLFAVQLLLGFRAASRARKAAALNPAYAELGKFAFAIEASLVVFAVGGSFVPLQYNEMFWHVIGFSIVLNGLAAEALATAPALAAAKAVPEGLSPWRPMPAAP